MCIEAAHRISVLISALALPKFLKGIGDIAYAPLFPKG